MKKQILPIALFIGLCLISCRKNGYPNIENEDVTEVELNSKTEIGKWKSELLDEKLIGFPCNNSLNPEKWGEDNPDLKNGLPPNDEMIHSAMSDFDQNGKEDLLLYFISENCSGHNGGTPSFAKIIYSNGSKNSNLMSEITTAILNEYNQLTATDKTLKEGTNDYLDSTTTITFDNGMIKGEFKLYAKGDAHCCPSYNGKYTYSPMDKKASIEILKAKN